MTFKKKSTISQIFFKHNIQVTQLKFKLEMITSALKVPNLYSPGGTQKCI